MRALRWSALPAVLLLGQVVDAQTPSATSLPPFETKILNERIELDAHGLSTETVHLQLQANNAAAAQQIGQQPIGYSEALTDIEIVEAYTLKSDGRKLPVSPNAIYTQLPQGTNQAPMFDDLKQKVVIFPDVEAGDRIDLTFRRHDKQSAMPGQFMFARGFSRLVSFENADITLVAPRSYPLVIETHDIPFDRHDAGANTVYHWHFVQRAPADSVAPIATSFEGSPRFLISSFKDYDSFGHAFADLVAPEEKVTPSIQKLADEVTRGVNDRRARAERLYNWVSKHIRYVGIEVGAGAIVPHDADTVIANGYGDCKDHVVVYSALLKAEGIPSEMVLINAGTAYTLPPTVVLGELDHAITWIPELHAYADTTAHVEPFGSLPFSEYGKPIVHATSAGNALRRMPLLQPGLATVSTRTVARLDASGKESGTSTITATGPFAGLLRDIALAIETAGPERAAAELLQKTNTVGSGSFSFSPPDDLAPTYTVVNTWSFGPFAEIPQSKRFVMPRGIGIVSVPGDYLLGAMFNAKPTSGDPIPCYNGHAEDDISLEAPPGWHFLQSPPNAGVQTAHVTFTMAWSQVGNTLHLHRDFTSTVDSVLCSGAERIENANVIEAIRRSYFYGAAIAPDSAKPMASLADSLRVADETPGIAGGSQVHSLVASNLVPTPVHAMMVAALYGNDGDLVRPGSDFDRAQPMIDVAQRREQSASSPTAVASALEAHEDFAGAERALSDAITANADVAELYDQRGVLRQARGLYDAATADFTKAVGLATEANEASRYFADRAMSYWFARDWRPALADYSEAVKRNGSNADALEGRGRSEMFAGKLAAAVDDLTRAADLKKDDPYSAMWLFIAETRAGRNAKADFRARTVDAISSVWPAPLMDAYRGNSLASSVPARDPRQTCEENFYLGELALANGDRSGASARFRAARATDQRGQIEYVAAGLELGLDK